VSALALPPLLVEGCCDARPASAVRAKACDQSQPPLKRARGAEGPSEVERIFESLFPECGGIALSDMLQSPCAPTPCVAEDGMLAGGSKAPLTPSAILNSFVNAI
jgi:hypothetical protein